VTPKFSTPNEIAYNKRFPQNPATLFDPSGWDNLEHLITPYEEMLERALKKNRPITKEQMVRFLGEKNYRDIVAFHADIGMLEVDPLWK
jgi:hypothetical protein